MMKKQLAIFLAGVMVVAPLMVTVWVILWAGSTIDGLVKSGARMVSSESGVEFWWFPGAGVIFAIVGIYFVGLLTRLWGFRWVLRLIDRMFSRLPGVKSIYESVRDILNLFGGDASKTGQAVRYRVPGTEIDLLGIRTSTNPVATKGSDKDKVAVYLPMSYMIGGPTVYVSPDSLEPVDMSVEEAMKVAAIAGASTSKTTNKK